MKLRIVIGGTAAEHVCKCSFTSTDISANCSVTIVQYFHIVAVAQLISR